jgi:hypothetical protein
VCPDALCSQTSARGPKAGTRRLRFALSRPVSRVLSPPERVTAIHLCGLPGCVGRAAPSLMTSLRTGLAEPPRSPWALVGSYPTVSPLPHPSEAVCSLWRFPAGHPGPPLAAVLPFGARTFLSARAPRPSGRLRAPPRCRPGHPIPTKDERALARRACGGRLWTSWTSLTFWEIPLTICQPRPGF